MLYGLSQELAMNENPIQIRHDAGIQKSPLCHAEYLSF
jgi:hypothetical protein